MSRRKYRSGYSQLRDNIKCHIGILSWWVLSQGVKRYDHICL